MIKCRLIYIDGMREYICNIDDKLVIYETYQCNDRNSMGRIKINLELLDLYLLAEAFSNCKKISPPESTRCLYEAEGSCKQRIRFIPIASDLVAVVLESTYTNGWLQHEYAIIHRNEFEEIQELFDLKRRVQL